MSEIELNQMVARMQAMAARAAGMQPAQPAEPGSDFTAMLQSALAKVNALQTEAGDKAKAFEAGTPGVDLAQVMISLQKANVAFEAATQVRNRLVSAYQEIMNMPI